MTASKKPQRLSSANVVAALENGPFRAGAHALLQEVRNATGYAASRSADALVVSCWPSRGIWFAGIEVKVDRADWKRELDAPRKAAEIMRWCDYWYIAAPAGIVEIGEVPETWGFYVIEGKKAVLAKPAPKLTPEPLTSTFVASILRNQAESLKPLLSGAERKGYDRAEAELGSDALEGVKNDLAAACAEVSRLKTALEFDKRSRESLERELAALRRITGVDDCTDYNEREIAAAYRVARALRKNGGRRLLDDLDAATKALRAVDEQVVAAEEEARAQ